jgi:hypothetical protein
MSEAYGTGRRAMGAEATVRPVKDIGVMQACESWIVREKVRPSCQMFGRVNPPCQGRVGHSVLSGGMEGSFLPVRRDEGVIRYGFGGKSSSS